MKVRFDDIGNTIEIFENNSWIEVFIDNQYGSNYDEIVKAILTPRQFRFYVGIDTARTFLISSKKYAILESYLSQ